MTDITGTAQVAVQAIANQAPWWHYVIAALFGWALPAAIQKNPVTAQGAVNAIKGAAKEVSTLAPAVAMAGTLSGNMALAGGAELAGKIADQVGKTQDPNQLAALAVMHGQALAAAAAPSTNP